MSVIVQVLHNLITIFIFDQSKHNWFINILFLNFQHILKKYGNPPELLYSVCNQAHPNPIDSMISIN
jgi:hypothetical protein